eukprot:g32989.t1
MRWFVFFSAVCFHIAPIEAAEPASSPAEKFLHEGRFAEGETALLLFLDKHPRHDEARFGLGAIQFVRAVDNLGKALYEYGAVSENASQPFLRLPVPKNESPSAISYRALGRVLDAFANDLARAEATLAKIRDDKVKLRLRLAKVTFDFSSTGKHRSTLLDILTKLNGGRFQFQKQNPDFRIHFDRGDVAWLRAYCHLLSAIVDGYRAVDEEAGFEQRVRRIFPKIDAPAKKAQLDHWRGLNVVDAPRLRRMRLHLLAVCELNRETWKYIRSETDDDFEWLPHPKQTSQLGMRVTDERIDRWLNIMAECEGLLNGERVLPDHLIRFVHTEHPEGQGLNLKKLLDDPPADLLNDRRIATKGVDAKYLDSQKEKKVVNVTTLFAFVMTFTSPLEFAYAAWRVHQVCDDLRIAASEIDRRDRFELMSYRIGVTQFRALSPSPLICSNVLSFQSVPVSDCGVGALNGTNTIRFFAVPSERTSCFALTLIVVIFPNNFMQSASCFVIAGLSQAISVQLCSLILMRPFFGIVKCPSKELQPPEPEKRFPLNAIVTAVRGTGRAVLPLSVFDCMVHLPFTVAARGDLRFAGSAQAVAAHASETKDDTTNRLNGAETFMADSFTRCNGGRRNARQNSADTTFGGGLDSRRFSTRMSSAESPLFHPRRGGNGRAAGGVRLRASRSARNCARHAASLSSLANAVAKSVRDEVACTAYLFQLAKFADKNLFVGESGVPFERDGFNRCVVADLGDQFEQIVLNRGGMCVVIAAAVVRIANNVQLADGLRREFVQPGDRVVPVVLRVDKQIGDVEQQAATGFFTEPVDEFGFAHFSGQANLRGDVFQNDIAAGRFSEGAHVLGKQPQLFVCGGNRIQFDRVLDRLKMLLAAEGSSLKEIVKLNVYVTSDDVAETVRRRLTARFEKGHRPAVAFVVTALPHPQAQVAIDAVAATTRNILRKQVQGPLGRVTVSPGKGRLIYISGQAERTGDLAAATRATMNSLFRTLKSLKGEAKHVVQVKTFLQPMKQSADVDREIARFFPRTLVPPVSHVEWTARLIEIEMVAFVPYPANGRPGKQTVRFETPAWMTSSPVFSRVAIVESDELTYVAGLYGPKNSTAAGQVRDIFARLKKVTAAAGSDLKHLAKATYYVADNEVSSALNKQRPEYYDPKRPPAASKAAVVAVGSPGRRITLDIIAAGLAGTIGLSLPDLLRMRAESASKGKAKSETAVIYVELAGGPTQHETYDPKPDAPQEYRGPLGTVKTSAAGVVFSELMAEQAKIFDKLAVIRSMHHNSGSHGTSSHLTQTGYYLQDRQSRDNDMPCIGSYASRIRGANKPGVPAFVSIPREMRFGRAAWLGKGYNAFTTGRDADSKNFQVPNLTLMRGLTSDRLEDRRALLKGFDATRRTIDTRGVADAIDQFTGQAFDMVTGDAARQAFDIQQENDATRDRYGRNKFGQNMLLARRLVEHGVTFVTVRANSLGSWDDHNGVAKRMRAKGPGYDQGVAALVRDLHERGLAENTMVVCMGEFGRTPRVNRKAGRDHWGRVMSVVLAGGNIKTGVVVGSSDSKGAVPADRPYRPENVLAMLYRHMGIDPVMTFPDHSGRPRYLLERRKLITELV